MWAGPGPGKLSALGSPGSRRLGAREAGSAAARWCKSSEARRARWTLRRCSRSRGASVSLVHSSRSQFLQALEQLAMAPRKNAKGGGGNSSSSGSGSGSGSPSTGSSGSSSSPGARREAKHGGHKNGRRGGISGGSFFTWFMVIALLGVWTSVAVVWFDLVDYEEVLGLKEVSPSERTFQPEEAETQAELEEQAPEGEEVQNVEDEVKEQLQSLLRESVHTDHDLEVDGPAGEPQPEVEDFLTVTDSGDRFEDLEPGTVHEETEDSYHMEETVSQDHPNDQEEMMNEQENSDHSEAVTDADGLQQHAEEVRHQDYDEPEINVASMEEQQDTPPDT